MKYRELREDNAALRRAVISVRIAGWVLALALVLALPAWGQNCDRPADLDESAECARLRLRAAEREMLEQMRVIEASEDNNLKKAIAAAQDAWLKWRDAEGEVAVVTSEDARAAAVNRDTVKAQLTEDRVRDLRTHTGN